MARNTVKAAGEYSFLMVLSLFFGIVPPTFAQEFSLKILAQTGQIIDGVSLGSLGSPSLNDKDIAAFTATFSGGKGIFTQYKLIVKTGDTIDSKTLTDIGDPALNNEKEVAFSALFSGGDGIFKADRVCAEPGDVIDGHTVTSFSAPVQNNNGLVLFPAILGSGGVGIFTRDCDGACSVVAVPGDVIDGKTLTNTGEPEGLNDNDDVAFTGEFSSGRGIFTKKGVIRTLAVQTGDTIDGRTLTDLSDPRLTDDGDVLFLGTFSGGEGIFSVQQGRLLVATGSTIANRTLTDIFSFSLHIRSSDFVAFSATFSGGTGVFTQDTLIAESGDTVESSKTLSSVGGVSLNDNDEVAFHALFTDSSEGIVLATPAVDHFKCYTAKGQALQTTVSLADQFETKDTEVSRPMMICNPVSKNGKQIIHPEIHLTCYKIKDAPNQAKFEKREVLIQNQLDEQSLKVTEPEVLCLPSSKEEVTSD